MAECWALSQCPARAPVRPAAPAPLENLPASAQPPTPTPKGSEASNLPALPAAQFQAGSLSFIFGLCCLPITQPSPLVAEPAPTTPWSGWPSLHPPAAHELPPSQPLLSASLWHGSSCRSQGRGRCAHVSLTAKAWRGPSTAHQVHLSEGWPSPELAPGAARPRVAIRWALRGHWQPSAWGWARAAGVAGSDDAVALLQTCAKATGCHARCCQLWPRAPEGTVHKQNQPQHRITAGHCCHCDCYFSLHRCHYYFTASGPPMVPRSASGRLEGKDTVALGQEA